MTTLKDDVFGNHAPVSLGRLRNGAASAVTRTARESSISAKYFYNGVRYREEIGGDASAFRTACPAIVLFEAQFRNTLYAIIEAAVEEGKAAHKAAQAAGGPTGGNPFDEAAARAQASASANNRLEAIAIGAARTSAVLSFEITAADLRATESSDCVFNVVAPAAYASEVAYLAAARTATAGWTVKLARNTTGSPATAAEKAALGAKALTADECDLAFAMMAIGQVSPVRAGAQLFTDGHHYLSDPAASARHRAIETEVMGGVSQGAKNLWTGNIMLLRNAVWHAAIHPIETGVLQSFAEDPNMPARLENTKFGSFSVGLPAQEDLFRRAGSYLAVLKQVGTTAADHGHEVSLDELRQTVIALGNIGRAGASLPTNRPDLPGIPGGAWPNGCDTRAKVLRLYLEPALDKAEPVAAWLFGYYKSICERGGIRANSQEGSLLRSYSLKRAVTNHLAEAVRAQEMFSAVQRNLKAQGDEGKLSLYTGHA